MISIIETNLSYGYLNRRRTTKRIIVHHSASDDVPAATIHGWHIARKWSGIGYHFVIRQNGDIERGRRLNMIGAHAGPQGNGDSIGICLTGNFMETKPTRKQIHSLTQLVSYLREYYQSDLEVWRHKDVVATDCPGNLFPWPENNWPLFAAPRNEAESGNTIEPWKNELITISLDKKLITEPHNPDDPAPKWFVVAMGLNILKEVQNGK